VGHYCAMLNPTCRIANAGHKDFAVRYSKSDR